MTMIRQTFKNRIRKNKHFLLDQDRLKKAQEVLGTRTETETIEIEEIQSQQEE